MRLLCYLGRWEEYFFQVNVRIMGNEMCFCVAPQRHASPAPYFLLVVQHKGPAQWSSTRARGQSCANLLIVTSMYTSHSAHMHHTPPPPHPQGLASARLVLPVLHIICITSSQAQQCSQCDSQCIIAPISIRITLQHSPLQPIVSRSHLLLLACDSVAVHPRHPATLPLR